MKNIINYLTLMFGLTVYCQEVENSLVLPNINPPSPESFKFSEFGKNAANEYTGKINLNVPIYEYIAGELKMPISLNYSGAGVKVEDMSSWVGINWNLSVGGVITRQINDASDEGVYPRININEEHLKANAKDLCAPFSQYYWGLALNDDFNDTEVDIFNFSFMGYSGSFFLDTNFNPVYIENENELKIEIIGSYSSNKENFIQNKKFCITTPDGTKYFFGGNVTESTRVLSGAHSNNKDGITSFFLYRIEHPVNGVIILEYDTLNQITQDLSKNYSMTTQRDFTPVTYTTTLIESIFRTRVNDSKRLRKISSLNNNIEIVFNRNDYGNYNYSSVLNNIEVLNKNTTSSVLKKVNFEYGAKNEPTSLNNNFENANRFFLTKIKINNDLDSQGNKHEEYNLEYDDPYSLPERKSNKKDALGYYNNKNNLSSIPLDERYNFNLTYQFADLNPDFNYSKKGSLTKIIYPTKGYSEFEYEPLPAKKDKIVNYSLIINSCLSNEDGLSNFFTIPGNNILFGGEEAYVNSPTVSKDQKINFNLNFSLGPHLNSSILGGKGVEFIITDLTTSMSTTFTRTFPLVNNTTYFYDLIKGHNYTFQLKFINNYTSPSPDANTFGVSVSFNVFEGYDIINGLGIRLKRQKNYSYANSLVDQKRYYYGSINGGYNDVAKLPYISFYPKQTFKASTDGNGVYLLNITFSSEIVDIARNTIRNPELFPVVSISHGGDNFEMGGVEKNFIDIYDSNISRIDIESDGCWGAPLGGVNCGLTPEGTETVLNFEMGNYKSWEKTNNSYYNGKILYERYYSNIESSLYKIREIKNEFKVTQDFAKTVTNFVGRRMSTGGGGIAHNWCPENPNIFLNSMMPLYFGYYKTRVLSLEQISSTTTEYIDYVSMNDYSPFKPFFPDPLIFGYINHSEYIEDDSSIVLPSQAVIEAPFKKIITNQTFEFGLLKGLPTRITCTNSDGSVKSIVNTYVNDFSSLSGVNSDQTAAYNALNSQNIIATPIQVEEYKNLTDLISTKRTTFKQDSFSHVFPELIQYAKGTSTLEDRIVFEEYDAKGNPTLLSYKDGTKTKYLYNGNNQVIVKIENFTGTLNPNTNMISGNLCDFINSFPNSFVTIFIYNPTNNLLTEIIDKKCQKTTYIYDSLLQLKEIKDNNDNIIQEFDNNYRQN